MDLTPGPYEDRLSLANVLHEADCGWNCHGHGILGPGRDALYERMATAALDKLKIGDIREAAYRAGREDAARQPAEPIEEGELLTADRVRGLLNSAERGIWLVPPPWTGGYHEHVAKWLEQVAEQIVAGLAATPEQQGALSLAQAYLTWRAGQVDQPRTPSGCDGEDSPEERQR